MAAFTRSVVMAATVISTVPMVVIAVGYRLHFAQVDDVNSFSGVKRICRVCDLPIYPAAETTEPQACCRVSYPFNPIEEGVHVFRRTIQDLLGELTVKYSTVEASAITSFDHCKANVMHIQSSSGELPRAALITSAGLGGSFLGYARMGGPSRKLTYGLLAAMTCAVVCYWKEIVIDLNLSAVDLITILSVKPFVSGVKNWLYQQGSLKPGPEISLKSSTDGQQQCGSNTEA